MFESCCAAAALSDRSPYPEPRFGGHRADCVFFQGSSCIAKTREVATNSDSSQKAVMGESLRPYAIWQSRFEHWRSSPQYVNDYRGFAEEIPFCFIPFQNCPNVRLRGATSYQTSLFLLRFRWLRKPVGSRFSRKA